MTSLIAAVSAGAAVHLVFPSRAAWVRMRLGVSAPRGGHRWWIFAVVAGSVVYAAGPVAALLATVVSGVAWFVWRRIVAHRRRRERLRRIDQAAEAVDAIAAELTAGAAPARALERVSQEAPLLRSAAVAAGLGGDVPGALRSVVPPVSPLIDLAAAWQVADRTGAPLVDVLEGIADHLAAQRETRREIQASLGPARATGHTLAFLPALGVALGTAMGHDPLGFLTQTVAGALLLAAGSALACLGVWWVERQADRAEAAA